MRENCGWSATKEATSIPLFNGEVMLNKQEMDLFCTLTMLAQFFLIVLNNNNNNKFLSCFHITVLLENCSEIAGSIADFCEEHAFKHNVLSPNVGDTFGFN